MSLYTIGFLHTDRHDWMDILETAIANGTRRHTGTSSLIGFVQPSKEIDLVICLGSANLATDPSAEASAKSLLHDGIRILPVVSRLTNFHAEMPPSLDVINGMAWK